VNLILFELPDISSPCLLPRSDPRAEHVIEILHRKVGETLDVGLVNGPRGKATIVALTDASLLLDFAWGEPTPPLAPLTLIVGLPRPQTARKILQEASALGVSAIYFVKTERGETSYASSTLWASGEWRRHVLAGVAQAFCTRLPEVSFGQNLGNTLAVLPPEAVRIGLDNYESSISLRAATQLSSTANTFPNNPKSVILAIGSERGWTGAERTVLRENRFTLAHLGSRVLRTETACVAAIAIVKSTLDWA
jgi:RsmE family RNA methyltransferase